jgi:hypothetical protein
MNLDFMLLGFVAVLHLRNILNQLLVVLRYFVLYVVLHLDRVGLGAHCQQQHGCNNLPETHEQPAFSRL